MAACDDARRHAAHPYQTHDVDVVGAVPFGIVIGGNVGARADACVVDDDVDAAELRHDGRDGGSDGRVVGNVGADSEQRRVRAIDHQVETRNLGPACGEQLCALQADPQ